jgi:anti-anti-sigma factor
VDGAGSATTGPEWDGHLLLLHDPDAEWHAAVAAWVQRGLGLGEKVIYTQDPAEQDHSVIDALEARGVDAATAVVEGRLALLPLAECHPTNGHRQLVDQALAEGFPAVRLSTGDAAAMTMLSPGDYLSVDERIDELVRTLPVSVLCEYVPGSTISPGLWDVVGVHVPGIREARFHTGTGELGLVLRGEVDASSAEVLEAAVTAFTDGPPRMLCLELAELSFVDVAACRALAHGSSDFRASGGQVLLVAPPPPVERTLRLLGLSDLPGFQLDGGAP